MEYVHAGLPACFGIFPFLYISFNSVLLASAPPFSMLQVRPLLPSTVLGIVLPLGPFLVFFWSRALEGAL